MNTQKRKVSQLSRSPMLAMLALLAVSTGCEQDYKVKIATSPQDSVGPGRSGDGPDDVNACGAGTIITNTINFNLQRDARNSNVIFVVDTSSSMGDEVAQLRSNLTSFVQKVKSEGLAQNKVKFVITGTEGDLKASGALLPAPYVKNANVDDVYWHGVEAYSRDKLQVAMGALGLTKYGIYGIPAVYKKVPGLDIRDGSPCANGNLFDCEALNHIVVITDDGENLSGCTGTTAAGGACMKDTFLKTVEPFLAKTKSALRFHSIYYKKTSVQSATCKPGATTDISTVYDELTSATGGLSLDVCQSDWSPLFNQLKDRIISTSTASALLQCGKTKQELLQVSVKLANGQVVKLSPSDVTFTATRGNETATVYLAPSTLLDKGIDPAQVTQLIVESRLK